MTKQRQCWFLMVLAVGFGGAGFVFLPTPNAIHAQTREEVVLWESVKGSNSASDFLAYLDKYPQGTFATVARRHIRALTTICCVRVVPSVIGVQYYPHGSSCNIPDASGEFAKGIAMNIYMELKGAKLGDEVTTELISPTAIRDTQKSEQTLQDGLNCLLTIPTPRESGKWQFRLLVNGIEFGHSSFSVK